MGKSEEVKRAWVGKGLSYLDALIDTIHYPVEEAAVNILCQGIPSILSLEDKGGDSLITVAVTEQSQSQLLQEGSYLHHIQHRDYLLFACLHRS